MTGFELAELLANLEAQRVEEQARLDSEFGVHAPQALEAEAFFNPLVDVAQYEQAAAWWPLNVPPQHACPSATALAAGYAAPTLPPTFLARLERAATAALGWLRENGREPHFANVESKETRRRRLNREAQERYREKHGISRKRSPELEDLYEQRKRINARIAEIRASQED